MNPTQTVLKAFKRTRGSDTSAWYKGILTTYLVTKDDSRGNFALIEGAFGPGFEPPPHVHSREDELFYVLDGEMDVYVGTEAFKVNPGACVFLPKLVPHAFLVRSVKLHVLALLTPGGLEEAFRSMAAPANTMEKPAGMQSYAEADLTQTVEVLRRHGVTLLAPDEVEKQLPGYPKPLPAERSE
jgi:mannose-6-phosphate isomerase-like protein (cupin superfamily)